MKEMAGEGGDFHSDDPGYGLNTGEYDNERRRKRSGTETGLE